MKNLRLKSSRSDRRRKVAVGSTSAILHFVGLVKPILGYVGYSTTHTTVRLETNVYDIKTKKLISSGQTKTWNKKSQNEIINDVVKTVVEDMLKSKLIKTI